MQISAVAKEINEWSGSVLICGILEGRIESQINSFKTITKDTYLSQRFIEARFEGQKSQKLLRLSAKYDLKNGILLSQIPKNPSVAILDLANWSLFLEKLGKSGPYFDPKWSLFGTFFLWDQT